MNKTAGQPQGIGGWLILVAIFVLGAPLIQLSAIVEFGDGFGTLSGIWAYSPPLAILIVVEAFCVGAFLPWACFNVYLFFKRRSTFPKSWAWFLIINWLYVVADSILAEQFASISVTPDELARLFGQLVSVVIWSSYVLRSKRVKNTFVVGESNRRSFGMQFVLLAFGGLTFSIGLFISGSLYEPEINEQTLTTEAQNVSILLKGQLISEGVVFDRAESDGMTFTYQYRLTDGSSIDWDVNELVAIARPSHFETACTEMRDWLKAGVTIQYRYVGNDGLHVATLDFHESDCPAVVAEDSAKDEKMSVRGIAEKAKSSFVSIGGYIGVQPASNGSGFIVREDGVLVTSLHVLQDVDKVKVELPSGETYERVFVLSIDERRDLALLQIPATGLSPLRIGDDRAIEVGDSVFVLGNPLGFDQTFTDGILSARRVSDGIEQLQITAPISKGSSGGPVLNEAGEAIGIATAFMPDAQNLNIAMPAHYVSGMLAIEGEPLPFETFVGTDAFSTSETVSERAAETRETLALLPVELQNKLSEYDPWTQAVVIRMLSIGAGFEELGWDEIELDRDIALLKNEEYDSFPITLEPGTYVAFGVCDDDCTNLDLGVGYEGIDPVSDTENDAAPVVRFELGARTDVVIAFGMESCATESCAYMIGLYRE